MQNKKPGWRHDSELALVRDWFFPNDARFDPYSELPPDMRQRAIQHVEMWSVKDADLTHAVIATAGLTEAILHDELEDRQRYISDAALQSIYAMAFCRFVNGLVDREVVKATKAALAVTVEASADEEASATANARNESSMFAHARRIELPIEFVELRHRATHGKMPELGYLRMMTKQGLEWLHEKWWRKYATGSSARALRRLELERVEAEAEEGRRKEFEMVDGVEGKAEAESGLNGLWGSADGANAGRNSVKVADSDTPDETLCARCRKRNRGLAAGIDLETESKAAKYAQQPIDVD